jgi:hypothetical protein
MVFSKDAGFWRSRWWCVVAALAATSVAQAENVDWLVGCWVSFGDYSQEVWVKTPDAALIGFSVSVLDDDVSFYESLYIREVGGTLTYTAYPSGQSATTFIARDVAVTSVVFENPAHDYPQVIAYRLEGDELWASISDAQGEKKITFKKQRCE